MAVENLVVIPEQLGVERLDCVDRIFLYWVQQWVRNVNEDVVAGASCNVP